MKEVLENINFKFIVNYKIVLLTSEAFRIFFSGETWRTTALLYVVIYATVSIHAAS